jgi:hypothetical protein
MAAVDCCSDRGGGRISLKADLRAKFLTAHSAFVFLCIY